MGSGINETNDTIEGATDGTRIGNVGDRFKVDSYNNPLNDDYKIYKIESLLNSGSAAMNVNGSVTPVVFTYSPASGQYWFVKDLTMIFGTNGDPNSDQFGAATALTNGILIEAKINGTNYAMVTIKTNKGLSKYFAEDRGFGNTADKWFKDAGGRYYAGSCTFDPPMKLNGTAGDYIRATVQDNLTSHLFLEMSAHVWRVVT